MLLLFISWCCLVILIKGEESSCNSGEDTCSEINDIFDNFKSISLLEIDINEFLNANISQKIEIANILDEQLHRIGSFRIKNHGLSLDKMNKLYSSTKAFFEEPTEFKSQYATKGVLGKNGYEGIGTKNIEYSYNSSSKKDPVESLQFWYVQLLDIEQNKINKYCPDNLFKDIVSYFKETRKIANILQEMFTLALGLNVNKFAIDMTDINDSSINTHYFNQFALWNFPDLDINEDEMSWDEFDNKKRFGTHSDWSCITLLRNDNIPGLQIKLERIDNEWYTINNDNISDDTLTINLGEVMEMYTAGYWLSAAHRVITLSKKRRMSIVSFFGPNMNRIIDELKDCHKCKQNRNQTVMNKYDLPMRFKKHALMRFGGGFEHDQVLPFWL